MCESTRRAVYVHGATYLTVVVITVLFFVVWTQSGPDPDSTEGAMDQFSGWEQSWAMCDSQLGKAEAAIESGDAEKAILLIADTRRRVAGVRAELRRAHDRTIPPLF